MCRYILPLPADTIAPVQQGIFVTCGLCQIQSHTKRSRPRTNITGCRSEVKPPGVEPATCVSQSLSGALPVGLRYRATADTVGHPPCIASACKLSRCSSNPLVTLHNCVAVPKTVAFVRGGQGSCLQNCGSLL